MNKKLAKSPEDFDPICRDLISRYQDGIVVILSGVLGAGKTAFVKRFALAFSAKEAASPTFGIMHEYAPNLRHFDLYRIGSEDFFARGLYEELDSGWSFIEWADETIENYLKKSAIKFIKITIELDGDLRLIGVYDE
ncbi:MAG: tRNA (adenosine(37)-N6)-threonylcarbamoyltransferase complex ATPase subunit type 1 TsaE [Helicobacteraceae bacterium]|jgi:tRNA threonylcarbamoyladenosine biosynthesis protein TsaE|nr:tRNA (adenosine(37)-N6)-threonylcarbamoyltransferase complex ATPase subunit type 1 TsaE [Helicobacteraceae bacterium]